MSGGLLLGNSAQHIVDPESGQWINASVHRIAELINDFDPTLRVVWIRPEDRDATDTKPYGIAQIREGHEPYVFVTLEEEEMNHTLLAKLMRYQANAHDLNAVIDSEIEASRLAQEREVADKRAEEMDRAYFHLKTPLHTINMGGGRKLHT